MNPGYDKVAGIDIHKKMLAVVVAQRTQPDATFQRKKFGTTVRQLRELARWLEQEQVGEAAMESTAKYWKPVWDELEGKFKVHLAQARSTKAPRGRKTDFKDAERIVKRLLADDLTLSYVPEPEQRMWRLLGRTRTDLARDRTRVRNRLEGLLEEARIKLSSYVSDLLGASGRRILQALADGVSDPEKLAALGSELLRASKQDLREALSGKLRDEQRLVLRIYLKQIQEFDEQIVQVEEELARRQKAHQEAIGRLCEVPGISAIAAQQMVAELGPEAAVFPSPGQMASWIGVCPGRQESAGESSNNRSPKGNRAMRGILVQTAWSAVRTKGSWFQELYQRMIPRMGAKKAIWAVAHRMSRVIWKILHDKVRYEERGSQPPDPEKAKQRVRKHMRALQKLGFQVTLEAAG